MKINVNTHIAQPVVRTVPTFARRKEDGKLVLVYSVGNSSSFRLWALFLEPREDLEHPVREDFSEETHEYLTPGTEISFIV